MMTASAETAEHPPQWAALANVTAALAMFGATTLLSTICAALAATTVFRRRIV